MPAILPPCFSESYARVVPAQPLSIPPFKKSLCGCHCLSEPLPSFPRTPALGKSRVHLHHGQVQPSSGSSSRCSQKTAPPPCHSPALYWAAITAPARMCHQLYEYVQPVSPQWVREFKSLLARVCGLPALGGDGTIRLIFLIRLPSSVVPATATVSGAMPRDFPHPPIKAPYHPF